MHEQNQIASTLASADGTERLKDLLAQAGSASRAEMGRRVCQAFGFHDVRGRPQLAGCMKALRALDAHGRIQLPAPRHERRLCRPRRLGRPVPAPTEVPAWSIYEVSDYLGCGSYGSRVVPEVECTS